MSSLLLSLRFNPAEGWTVDKARDWCRRGEYLADDIERRAGFIYSKQADADRAGNIRWIRYGGPGSGLYGLHQFDQPQRRRTHDRDRQPSLFNPSQSAPHDGTI